MLDIHKCIVSLNATVIAAASLALLYAFRNMVNTHNRDIEQMLILRQRVLELEAELSKWKKNQGKGKRPNRKIQAMYGDIKKQKATGASNRSIARQFGISEGTVRRMVAVADGRESYKTVAANEA